MCLIVKEGCKIEIAEKDITTYKYIDSYKDYWCGIYYSVPRFLYNEIQRAQYLDSETWLSSDLKHLVSYLDNIYEGFHSQVINTNAIQKICVIPKGSEYCLGNDNDIVSNQIIVFKTKEDYDKYITPKISSN